MRPIVIRSGLTAVSPVVHLLPEKVPTKDSEGCWTPAVGMLQVDRAASTLSLDLYGEDRVERYPVGEWARVPEHIKSTIVALGLGPDIGTNAGPGTDGLPEGEDIEVGWVSFLRVGDWIRREGRDWERASLSLLIEMRGQDPYQRVTVRWPLPIMDWEALKAHQTQTAPHTFRIHQGHPQHRCPLTVNHGEHDHRYVYRNWDDEIVVGSGTCMGLPESMLPAPAPEEQEQAEAHA